MCLYGRLIKNKKYTANKKNGGIIPPQTDLRTAYVPIACGNCIECKKKKSREWQIRLLEDIRTHTNGKFVTLTFSNRAIAELAVELPEKKGYELDNAIATLAMRRFVERWRKIHGISIRHWLITELGHEGTENIHMHGIMWGTVLKDQNGQIIDTKPLDLEKVEKIWQYGHIWKGKKYRGQLINYVNDRTIGYMTKYVTQIDELHKTYKPIILTSPGIGGNYTKRSDAQNNKYNGEKTIETYRTRTGHKISMPIYWRNKIYTDEEREKLWLQKLDKQVRYVMGEKIDISKGEEEYYKVLRYYQQRNRELGYNSDEKDWSRAKYEEERRQMMQAKRIAIGLKK